MVHWLLSSRLRWTDGLCVGNYSGSASLLEAMSSLGLIPKVVGDALRVDRLSAGLIFILKVFFYRISSGYSRGY